jgi:peptide-methionine (R)-S-oxide reductase
MATESPLASGFDLTPPTDAQRASLESSLTREEAEVLLRHGTEAAFCGGLLDNKTDGVYCCRLCGLPLFRAQTKFDSGTGWPSFYAPYDPKHLLRITDRSYGMVRVEIRCARCGSHQGHVFPDGPRPTGERYCINSVSLSFVRQGEALPDPMRRGDHLPA